MLDHFDVHPSVVLKLGEELIADEFTAIVEAAKNSYDAGASIIRIRIDTSGHPDERYHSKYPKAVGTIVISDDGEGMESDILTQGWLIISYSRKRDIKRHPISGRGARRVPLGDKGIGRLGLQRLGDYTEVFTSTGEDNGHHVAFSWKDFETAQRLSDVPVTIESSTRRLRRGTEIVVSNLKRPEIWKGQDGRDRLQSKLSQLVSPFEELRECNIEATLNGSPLDLAKFSRKVLSVAEQHYKFDFDSKTMSVRGEFALEYLRLAAEGKQPVLDAINEDDGEQLVKYLCEREGPLLGDLRLGEKSSARLIATRSVELASLGDVALEPAPVVQGKRKQPVSPGPFSGELFHFDRRERAGTFDRANDFKAFLDAQKGVRIYRNGFAFGRYGVDGGDWLGLGEAWTAGTSWYGLKPANILGYISVSARDNPLLVEKTDREGLTDSPAAQNFFRLVREVIQFANAVNTQVRRAILAFAKDRDLKSSGMVSLDSDSVERQLTSARSAAKRVKDAILKPDAQNGPTAKEVDDVDRGLSLASALTAEVERLKLEMRSTMDLAGLGLTAEALSHEIANIADQLAQRTKAISAIVGRPGTDPRIVEFVEHVRSAVAALRKQLAHLAPALRFARERKERFDVRDFLKDTEEFLRDRLAGKEIDLRIEYGNEGFPVRTSRGKLNQVIDNLVLNSEYWLTEEGRRTANGGRIRIRIRPPHVLVSDSGPGIDQSIEAKVFQPFVTLKPKGRGLGLFIVRQLLDSMGCSITLKSDRNQEGRRYIFDLDLSGAADDERRSNS